MNEINDTIVIGTLVSLWIVGVVGPILASLLSYVMYFVTRGDVDVSLFETIQKKLWNWMLNAYSWDGSDTGFSWFFLNVAALGVIYLVVGAIIINVPIMVAFSLLGVCLSPFILRFIADIIKSLKYNYKSGKAERIDALEAKIAKLEAK